MTGGVERRERSFRHFINFGCTLKFECTVSVNAKQNQTPTFAIASTTQL